MWTPEAIALVAGAYLLGAFPSAYIIARASRGIDIRQYGSGNVGISNVHIHVGMKGAVPLVIFDIVVKGSLPVIAASSLWLNLGLGVEVAVGVATIFGHNWSVFLKMRGGRGMATVLGVLVTLNWPLVVLYGSVAGLGWLKTRNSALWWGVAALLLPLWSLALRQPTEIVWLCASFIAIVAAKRLISNRPLNSSSERASVPLPRLLWNRLVFDRDIGSREKWVHRTPEGQDAARQRMEVD